MTKKAKLVKIDDKLVDDNDAHWNSKCTLTRMRATLNRVKGIPDDIRLQADLALQLTCVQAPHGMWPSFYIGREVDAWRAGKAAEILEPLVSSAKISGIDAYNTKVAVAYWRAQPINMTGELVHDIRMLELASAGLLAAIRLMCTEAYYLSGCGGYGTGADIYASVDRRMLQWANKVASVKWPALLRFEVAELRNGGQFVGDMLKGAIEDYLSEAPQDWGDVYPC